MGYGLAFLIVPVNVMGYAETALATVGVISTCTEPKW